MMQVSFPSPVSINILASYPQCGLIDSAVERLGTSRADFMLEAACLAAKEVLSDQTDFVLQASSFAQFEKIITREPVAMAVIQKLLATAAPWE